MTRTSFPSDIATNSPSMIRFRLFDSSDNTIVEPTATIKLPAPLALSNVYTITFDDLSAGLIEVAVSTALEKLSETKWDGPIEERIGTLTSAVPVVASSMMGDFGIV